MENQKIVLGEKDWERFEEMLERVVEKVLRHALHSTTSKGASGKDYLTSTDTAKYLGVSTHTLQYWRSHGGGPIYIKPKGRILYALTDLNKWIGKSGKKRHTSDLAKMKIERIRLTPKDEEWLDGTYGKLTQH